MSQQISQVRRCQAIAELTVNSGHISEKEIVASQNITEQSSVVKDNNSNKPGKAYIIDTTKSNQQNAEIFYNIEDRLINKSKIDSDSLTLLLKNKLIRYEESTIGECKITCKLTADKITVSKGKNYFKILAWFNNNKIFPLKINMIKYNLAEAIFSNYNEANLCLDTMDRAQTNDKSIIGFINNKSKFWRGVITDWPYDIPQLWQEIINKDEVTKMERMFRRVWNKEEKVMMNKKTDNIIITMKGSQLKENITIFENLQYKLKVRPYIEPVKQCYNCFRYGHIKSLCKSQTACINCGETAHGECNKITKCRNCGLEHKSTYRKCPIFEKNKIIKTIMAYNNVTFYEAERILSGTEDKSIQYDRYSKPNT